MLTNLWYVAEWADAVKNNPVRAALLGQYFVLFRDKAGKVHCLSDVCIHRRGAAQLYPDGPGCRVGLIVAVLACYGRRLVHRLGHVLRLHREGHDGLVALGFLVV